MMAESNNGDVLEASDGVRRLSLQGRIALPIATGIMMLVAVFGTLWLSAPAEHNLTSHIIDATKEHQLTIGNLASLATIMTSMQSRLEAGNTIAAEQVVISRMTTKALRCIAAQMGAPSAQEKEVTLRTHPDCQPLPPYP